MTRINLTREQMKAAYEAGILTDDDLIAINQGTMIDQLRDGLMEQIDGVMANLDDISEEAAIS